MRIKKCTYNGLSPGTDSFDAVLFAPENAEIHPLSALETALNGDIAAVVTRTAPAERPWFCDPVTLDISCADFCGFAVRADALDAVGGLDVRLGTAAATDLVWRLKAAGYGVRYLPAVITAARPQAAPYAQRLIESLLMRCKHGSFGDVCRGKILILKALRHPELYGVSRGGLLAKTLRAFPRALALFFTRSRCRGFAEFNGVDYAFSRGHYESVPAPETPKVSLIVRTCGRPRVLRKTLESLRHQTYKNLEVVVIEDGPPQIEEMLRTDFSDLPLVYKALGQNRGRAAAANAGFALATGEYLNLLDDDDFLMPEYPELAAARAQAQNADLVFGYSIVLETANSLDATDCGNVRGMRLMDFPRIDSYSMAQRCLVASNAVLFKKSLLADCGGMREDLGAHEDWSLWLRLMTCARWTTLPFAAGCFIVPADAGAEAERLRRYAAFDEALLDDETLCYSLTARELKAFHDNTVHDLMYLKQLGRLDVYIDSEYRKLTDGQP